ncbi:MAG: protein phosphatase CheZ [Candidatus Manganitrophaceae bacterium]
MGITLAMRVQAEDQVEGPLEEKKLEEVQAVGNITEEDTKKGPQTDLYGELGDLAKDMNGMLSKFLSVEEEMRQASADIPVEADQLTGLRRFTEEATHKILGYTEKSMDHHDGMAERLERLKSLLPRRSGRVKEMQKEVEALSLLVTEDKKVLMDLLMALEFQDLASQRLKKIAATLQEVQSRILKLVITFGAKVRGDKTEHDKEAHLLKRLETSSETETLNQGLVNDILKEFGF